VDDLQRFLALLKAGPDDANDVFNPWRDTDERDLPPRREMPQRRLDNLREYLEARRRSARVILMGEAPSHRGGRFTGIPFCSEVELLQKSNVVARKALRLTSVDCAEKPQRERSAAVVWGELEQHGVANKVVLWNTFPWHPRGAGSAASNRKPRPAEVVQGRSAYQALLACFTHSLAVFAVGRVAESALAQWPEAQCAGCLRHPAHGGEGAFREHFRNLVLPHL